MDDNSGRQKPAEPIQDTSQKSGAKPISWAILLPFAVALAVYCIYLVGVAFHQTYLDRFAISAGAFPKDRADYLVYAVEALLHDFGTVLGAVLKPMTLVKVFVALFIAGVFCWAMLEAKMALRQRYPMGLRYSPSRRVSSAIFFLLVAPLAGTYLVYGVPTLVTAITSLPILLGVSVANAVAADDMADFNKGCATHSRGKHCFVLLEGKDTVATGFIIEQSKDTVAMWDNGVVRLLPLDKRALISLDAIGR